MMKEIIVVGALTFSMLACFNINGFSQDSSKLCICFNSKTKYIELSYSLDSTMVVFTLTKEGFETERKRQKAKKEYSKAKNGTPLPISYYYIYLAINKPQKINSKKDIENCAAWTTVEKLRQKEFELPNGVGLSSVILVKKINNNTYLQWHASLLPKL